MEHVRVDDVDSWISPARTKRPLARALGAENLAVNYYELDPGEQFGFGYHRHAGQEELFYVLEGAATFETETGEVTVEAGEAVYFAPGEWQLGANEGDETVVALALGAPAETGETDIRRHCPSCGEDREVADDLTDDGDALAAVCTECGTETVRHS